MPSRSSSVTYPASHGSCGLASISHGPTPCSLYTQRPGEASDGARRRRGAGAGTCDGACAQTTRIERSLRSISKTQPPNTLFPTTALLATPRRRVAVDSRLLLVDRYGLSVVCGSGPECRSSVCMTFVEFHHHGWWRRGGAEPIADAMNGLDPGRVSRIVAQLLAKPLDVLLQRPAHLNVISPDDSVNEWLGQCHVPVSGQQVQELELRWRQHEAFGPKEDLIVGRVYDQVPADDGRAARPGVSSLITG